jgi:hypothetical protein
MQLVVPDPDLQDDASSHKKRKNYKKESSAVQGTNPSGVVAVDTTTSLSPLRRKGTTVNDKGSKNPLNTLKPPSKL